MKARVVIALAIILTLLMLSMTLAQFANVLYANPVIDPGPDLPRIYIRNDGNVEPATAPIERTGNRYKLTNDIVLYTIEIQRDDIILDGVGRTIQGYSFWLGEDAGNNGVILAGRKNVTIKRLNFEQYYAGVRVFNSSNITVVDNSFTNDMYIGVVAQESTFVLIEANKFKDLHTDINVPAVWVSGSRNTIRNNTLTGSAYGIKLRGSSNVILDNKIEIAYLPVQLDYADANVIARNNITGGGIWLFVNCPSNMIFGNNITGSVGFAIRITDGANNIIYGNCFANNPVAINLDDYGAVNNTFCGNTFAADSSEVHIYGSVGNFWDNGTIGNYWGNYNGTDNNGDGVGDVPYVIDANNSDNYPLMVPYNFEHDAIVLPPTGLFAAVLVAVVVIAVAAGLMVFHKKRKR